MERLLIMFIIRINRGSDRSSIIIFLQARIQGVGFGAAAPPLCLYFYFNETSVFQPRQLLRAPPA